MKNDNIENIDWMRQYGNFEVLLLDFNSISEVGNLENMEKLKLISLVGNSIKDIENLNETRNIWQYFGENVLEEYPNIRVDSLIGSKEDIYRFVEIDR